MWDGEKRMILSPGVYCQDESGNLNEDTISDGLKQSSIFNYFKQANNTKPRQKKYSQNRPPKKQSDSDIFEKQ